MAQSPQCSDTYLRAQQVPQHVTALLSHLTSRPGVQSTMILARKDGSIIQCTGELAASHTVARSASPVPLVIEAVTTKDPSEVSPTSPTTSTAAPAPAPAPYQPSQAETLAAHIFNFVASASALGLTLAHPVTTRTGNERLANGLNGGNNDYGGHAAGGGSSAPREEDLDTGREREEEDEIKLLRMRTRKHEIVVVPDRKYLLCVVHDATHGGSGSAGARVAR
ncbi:hypothetical protein N7539_004721 [Penicillium diatomitis]|uniref:Roadblock/LAMTOR2 domain-containing protein n=1 Tax=Penicillium diatomitis TaxID=2819901 RepID=A0A9W9X5K2_9EURO|nr:uncharacterized protein N7539_004721 [Penicillium diatomitis]KAJ5484733.1 hypothetical protein N7539_004721 [Penicillium diatomitis]